MAGPRRCTASPAAGSSPRAHGGRLCRWRAGETVARATSSELRIVTTMETRSTACPLDCPDLCGLTVTVDNGRVIEVNGDHRGPLTDGFICGKVRKIAEHMYGEDRLTTPLVRTGPKGSGQWSAIS